MYNKSAKAFLFAGMSMLALAGGFAAAGDKGAKADYLWQPVLDFETKLGNNRTLGTLHLIAPVYQDWSQMTFLDLRGVYSSEDTIEGNFGIGHRFITDSNWIIGGYGFFDRRRSQFNNTFSQATVGVEAMSMDWDFRFNFYQPLTEKRLISDVGPQADLSPNGSIQVSSGQTFEKGLRGYDIEIGRRIPGTEATRAYGAFYKFGGYSDNASIDGVRLRANSEVTDWLRLGVETQFDQVRGHNHYAEIRLRVPFGPEPEHKVTGIRKRMMTPITRDIDIVTAEAKSKPQPVVAKGGKGRAKIIFVDNTATKKGKGTAENPFNNLKDAEKKAKNADTIYVLHGDGTTTNMDEGITLDRTNMRLIGEGVPLTLDPTQVSVKGIEGSRLGRVVLRPAGQAPVITNTNGDAVTVSANNVEIGGLIIDGADGNGVYVEDANRLYMHNTTVRNSAANGVYAVSAKKNNNTVIFADNIFENNAQRGLLVQSDEDAKASLLMVNNIARNNGMEGINLMSVNTDFLLIGNTTEGNGSISGLTVFSFRGGQVKGDIINHTARHNVNSGIYLMGLEDSEMDVNVVRSQTNNNGDHGFYASSQQNADVALTVSNSISNNNADDGMILETFGSGRLNATFTANQTNGNAFQGLDITADQNSTLTVDVRQHEARGSGDAGITFRARRNSTLNANLQNAVIDNVAHKGLYASAGQTSNLTLSVADTSVTNSGVSGVEALDFTSGNFNVDLGGGSLASDGNNRIFDNGDFDAVVFGSDVKAENNWWGTAAGLQDGRKFELLGGSIDAEPAQTTDPWL